MKQSCGNSDSGNSNHDNAPSNDDDDDNSDHSNQQQKCTLSLSNIPNVHFVSSESESEADDVTDKDDVTKRKLSKKILVEIEGTEVRDNIAIRTVSFTDEEIIKYQPGKLRSRGASGLRCPPPNRDWGFQGPGKDCTPNNLLHTSWSVVDSSFKCCRKVPTGFHGKSESAFRPRKAESRAGSV